MREREREGGGGGDAANPVPTSQLADGLATAPSCKRMANYCKDVACHVM